jgi:hypothetical protein
VFDQYLNFISLEEDMFTLRNLDKELSYYDINKGDVKDTDMELIMETIVDSLFSVFVTLGTSSFTVNNGEIMSWPNLSYIRTFHCGSAELDFVAGTLKFSIRFNAVTCFSRMEAMLDYTATCRLTWQEMT